MSDYPFLKKKEQKPLYPFLTDKKEESKPPKSYGDSGLANLAEGLVIGGKALVGSGAYAAGAYTDFMGYDFSKDLQEWGNEYRKDVPDADGSWGQWFGQLIPSVLPTAAAIASAPFTGGGSLVAYGAAGGLGLASAGMGMMEYEDYKKSRGEEVSQGAKLGVGTAYGVAELALERMGLSKLLPKGAKMKIIGNIAQAEGAGKELLTSFAKAQPTKAKAILKKIGQGSAVEGTEESITELIQAVVDNTYRDSEDRFGATQILERMGHAMAGGALMGSGMGVMSYAAQSKIHADRRKKAGTVLLGEVDGEAKELMGRKQDKVSGQYTYTVMDGAGNVSEVPGDKISQKFELPTDQFYNVIKGKISETEAIEEAKANQRNQEREQLSQFIDETFGPNVVEINGVPSVAMARLGNVEVIVKGVNTSKGNRAAVVPIDAPDSTPKLVDFNQIKDTYQVFPFAEFKASQLGDPIDPQVARTNYPHKGQVFEYTTEDGKLLPGRVINYDPDTEEASVQIGEGDDTEFITLPKDEVLQFAQNTPQEVSVDENFDEEGNVVTKNEVEIQEEVESREIEVKGQPMRLIKQSKGVYNLDFTTKEKKQAESKARAIKEAFPKLKTKVVTIEAEDDFTPPDYQVEVVSPKEKGNGENKGTKETSQSTGGAVDRSILPDQDSGTDGRSNIPAIDDGGKGVEGDIESESQGQQSSEAPTDQSEGQDGTDGSATDGGAGVEQSGRESSNDVSQDVSSERSQETQQEGEILQEDQEGSQESDSSAVSEDAGIISQKVKKDGIYYRNPSDSTFAVNKISDDIDRKRAVKVIDRVVDRGIKEGKSSDEIGAELNAKGYTIGQASASVGSKGFVESRRNGGPSLEEIYYADNQSKKPTGASKESVGGSKTAKSKNTASSKSNNKAKRLNDLSTKKKEEVRRIAEEYVEERREMRHLSQAEKTIYSLGQFKVNQESFNRTNDKNNVTATMAKAYFKKGASSLDEIAMELSEEGVEITPEEVAEFMIKFPGGVESSEVKISPRARELEQEYYEIMGKNMNVRTAKQIAEKLGLSEKKVMDLIRSLETEYFDWETGIVNFDDLYADLDSGKIDLLDLNKNEKEALRKGLRDNQAAQEAEIERSRQDGDKQDSGGIADDDIPFQKVGESSPSVNRKQAKVEFDDLLKYLPEITLDGADETNIQTRVKHGPFYPQSKERVESEANRITKKWKNKPTIKVWESSLDFDSFYHLQTGGRVGGIHDVAGVFYNGQIHLIASHRKFRNNDTLASEVEDTILHEAVGHFGIRGLALRASIRNQTSLIDELNNLLDDVLESYEGNARLDAISRTYYRAFGVTQLSDFNKKKVMEAITEATGKDWDDVRREMAEEFIAHNAQEGATLSMQDKIIAFLRKLWRSLTGRNLKLNDNDLKSIIAQARKFVVVGDSYINKVSRYQDATMAQGTRFQKTAQPKSNLRIYGQKPVEGKPPREGVRASAVRFQINKTQEYTGLNKRGSQITTPLYDSRNTKVLPLPERYMRGYEEATGKNLSKKDKDSFLYKLGQKYSYKKGGVYIDLVNNSDLNGFTSTSGLISIDENGKPSLSISDQEDATGYDKIQGKKIKTNLFKKSAGWDWYSYYHKQKYSKINTLVSVETGGKHIYTLAFEAATPFELKNYGNSPSEPRLRPTTKGRIALGEYVATILVRGKEHEIYDKVVSYDPNDKQTVDRLIEKRKKREGSWHEYKLGINNELPDRKDRSTDADQMLLDKLGIKNAKYLGAGVEAAVYDIGRERVIRISNFNERLLNKLTNKSIDGLNKVYSTGKAFLPKRVSGLDSRGQTITITNDFNVEDTEDSRFNYPGEKVLYYSILEKIETEDVASQLRPILGKARRFTVENSLQPLFSDSIYNNVKWMSDDQMNEFKNLLTPTEIVDLDRIIEIYNNAKKEGIELSDTHLGNYGRSKDGKLVTLDITEDPTSPLKKESRKYDTPKNEIRFQKAISTLPFYENRDIIQPTTYAGGKTRVLDLGVAFDKRAKDLGYDLPFDKYTNQHIDQASNAMVWDIDAQLKKDDSGIGWYDVKTRSALELMSRVHPELATNQEAKLRFTLMTAIISQNNTVDVNFDFADRVYTHFKEKGKLPDFPMPGTSTNIIKENLDKAIGLIDEMGAKEFEAVLRDRKTVDEWTKIDDKLTMPGELVTTKVTGAMAYLGPKIGSFWGNLNGDFSTLTADLWFSRNWNRYFGNTVWSYNTYEENKAEVLSELSKNKSRSITFGYSRAAIRKDDKVFQDWVNQVAKVYADGGYKDKTDLNVKANTIHKNLKGKLQDTPRNGTERQIMRVAVQEAQRKLVTLGYPVLDIADIQAILWYNEKDLYSYYKALNRKAEKTDYEKAAQKIVKRKGLNSEVDDQFTRTESGAVSARNIASPEQLGRSSQESQEGSSSTLRFQKSDSSPGTFYANRNQKIDLAYGSREKHKEAIQKVYEKVSKNGYVRNRKQYSSSTKSQDVSDVKKRTFLENFKESGQYDFRGYRIETSQDAADVFAVQRSPHIEKSHVVFIKKGVVIGSSSYTLRRMGMTFFPPPVKIYNKAHSLGADEVYYLHNHPSGNIEPSDADIKSTEVAAEYFSDESRATGRNIRFKDSIILDSDKYTVINRDGSHSSYPYKSGPKKDLFNKRINIGKGSKAQDNITTIADEILKKERQEVAVFYLASDLSITGYDVFPETAKLREVRLAAVEMFLNRTARNAILTYTNKWEDRVNGLVLPKNFIDVINISNKQANMYFSETEEVPSPATWDNAETLFDSTLEPPKSISRQPGIFDNTPDKDGKQITLFQKVTEPGQVEFNNQLFRNSLNVLQDDMLKKMAGRNVKRVTIEQILKKQTTKKIEREIMQSILDRPEFKGNQFSFDAFKLAVERELMPLDQLSTTQWSNYGASNVGINPDNYESVVYNSHLDHGFADHFKNVFQDQMYDKAEWEIREIPSRNTFIAIDKNRPEHLTPEQTAAYIGTAGSKEAVQAWIDKQDQANSRAENVGVFGHARRWDLNNDRYVAEVQSDPFQKNKAEELVMKDILEHREKSHPLVFEYVSLADKIGQTPDWILNANREVSKIISEFNAWKTEQEKILKAIRKDRDKILKISAAMSRFNSEKAANMENKTDQLIYAFQPYGKITYKKTKLGEKVDFLEQLEDKYGRFNIESNITPEEQGVWNTLRAESEGEFSRYKVFLDGKPITGENVHPQHINAGDPAIYIQESMNAFTQNDLKLARLVREAINVGSLKDITETTLDRGVREIEKDIKNQEELTQIAVDRETRKPDPELFTESLLPTYKKDHEQYNEYRRRIRRHAQLKEKEIPNKVFTLQDKQFIAHRKNYSDRLLREEIKQAAIEGKDAILFPTPYTIAKIEGYIEGEDGLPYTLPYGHDIDTGLEEGDNVEMGNETYTVVSADQHHITLVDQEYIETMDPFQWAKDDVVNNIIPEIEESIGDNVDDSEVIAQAIYGNSNLREIVVNTFLGQYEEGFEYNDISSDLEDLLIENSNIFEYPDEYLQEMGYYPWYRDQNGDLVYSTADGEVFMQPDKYEVVDEKSFNIEDLDEEYQTVVKKYKELGDWLKKERAGNIEEINTGSASWIKTSITDDDLSNPTILFQRQPLDFGQKIGPNFYSNSLQSVANVNQGKATAEQWKAMLLKNGASQAELNWIGFDNEFRGKKPTKEEVYEFIQANQIEVVDVVKGNILDSKIFGRDRALEIWRGDGPAIVGIDDMGVESMIEEEGDINQYENFAIEEDFEGVEDENTLYSQYTLPGGENYKELLLTMPNKAVNTKAEIENKLIDLGYTYDSGKFLNKQGVEVVNSTNLDKFPYNKELLTQGGNVAAVVAPNKEVSDLIKQYNDRQLNEQLDQSKNTYKSSHYDEPNILSHIRFNEREVNGEKVLFIEELQSDWAQAGRKKGFNKPTPNFSEKLKEIAEKRWDLNQEKIKLNNEKSNLKLSLDKLKPLKDEEETALIKEKQKLQLEQSKVRNNRDYYALDEEIKNIDFKLDEFRRRSNEIIRDINAIDFRIDRLDFQIDDLRDQERNLNNSELKGVPNMPFKNTTQWLNLSMRRMIRYASENGFDRIAWVTGEQSAERYDLSKQINEIEWDPSDNTLTATNKENFTVIQETAAPDQLENYVGKEVAQKILDKQAESLQADKEKVVTAALDGGMTKEQAEKDFDYLTEEPLDTEERPTTDVWIRLGNAVEPFGVDLNEIIHDNPNEAIKLDNLDLQVGGEGMKSFYNKIVPNTTSKLLKKLDKTAKVEPILLDDESTTTSEYILDAEDIGADLDFEQEVIVRHRMTMDGVTDAFNNIRDAEAWIEKNDKGAQQQLSFPITPLIRQKAIQEGMPLFQKTLPTSEEPILEAYRLDKTRVAYQDRLLYLKRLIDTKDKNIDSKLDAYSYENLSKGIINDLLEKFKETNLRPIEKHIKHMVDTYGVTYDETQRYLKAKHIVEDDIEEGGIPIPQAQKIIRNFKLKVKSADVAKYEKLTQDVNQFILQRQFETGLISKERFDELQKQYKFYVPLRGFAAAMDVDTTVFTKDVIRKGRKSESGDPLPYLFAMAQTAIQKGQQNLVKQRLFDFVKEFPDSRLYTIKNVWYSKQNGEWVVHTQRPSKEIFDKYEVKRNVPIEGMTEEQYADFKAKNTFNKETVTALVNGRRIAIEFIGEGEKIGRAINGSDVDKAPKALQWLGTYTRMLTKFYTQYSPEFALRNLLRDMTTGLINVRNDLGAKTASQVLTEVPSSMNTLRKFIFNKYNFTKPLSPLKKWSEMSDMEQLQEFIENGSQTGYSDLKDVNTYASDMKNSLEKLKGNKIAWTKEQFEKMLKPVDQVNRVFENTVRFSAYKTLRDRGVKPEKAAMYAKDLTVNFNRKGNWSSTLGTIYLFFNASTQGVERLLRPFGFDVKNPTPEQRKVRKRAYQTVLTLASMGMALQVMNRILGGKDEDDEYYYDKLPDYTRTHNIILPNLLSDKEGDFIQIPLPYGYNTFFAVPDHMLRALFGQEKAHEAALKSFAVLTESFSPLGAPDLDSDMAKATMKYLTPTVLSPVLDLALNKNFAGYPIYKEPYPGETPRPDSQMYYKNVNPAIRTITDALNSATGGDKEVPGYIDINPETVEHLVSGYGGGAYQFVDNMIGLGIRTFIDQENSFTYQDDMIKKVPFVRNYTTAPSSNYPQSKFYENYREVKAISDIYDRYKKSDRQRAREYRKENISKIKLAATASKYKKTIDKLRDVKKAKMNQGKDVTKIDEQLDYYYTKFNGMYNGEKRNPVKELFGI